MSEHPAYACKVVTPGGVVFDDEVTFTHVTGVGGDVGAYASHAPLVADLRRGFVKLELPDDSRRTWATSSGFAKVHDSTALVCVGEAIAVDDITAEMAQEIIDAGTAELDRAKEQADKAEKAAEDAQHDLTVDEHPDIYAADVETAQRRVDWGEHLKSIYEHGVGDSE